MGQVAPCMSVLHIHYTLPDATRLGTYATERIPVSRQQAKRLNVVSDYTTSIRAARDERTPVYEALGMPHPIIPVSVLESTTYINVRACLSPWAQTNGSKGCD